MTSSERLPPAFLKSTMSLEERHEAQMAIWELEWRRCSRDPWYFASTYCKTLDEATERDWTQPFEMSQIEDCIRPFPKRCYPYLKRLTDYWLSEKLLLILKSRQVLVSWLMCCLYLWAAMFHRGVRGFLQSKKQKDANALIARCMFVFRQLPHWMQERAGCDPTQDQIRFPKIHSELWAIPQGADVIRSYTLTLWFNDETGAQKDCADSYKAARPSLGKGARACFVTSAKPGWFHKQFVDSEDGTVAPPPVERRELCEGLEFKRNRRNGFACLRLHYSADPEKRSPEWKAQARQGVSDANWKQEYECDFEAKAGLPAIPYFETWESRLVIPTILPEPHWPVFITSDYGPSQSPHATLFHTVRPDGVVVTFDEIYGVCPLGVHLEKVIAHPFFSRAYIYVLDRSCFRDDQHHTTTIDGQSQHMMRSVAQLHHEFGVYPSPAAVVSDSLKIAAIERHWIAAVRSWEDGGDKKPTWLICYGCVNLRGELPGIRWATTPDHLVETRNPSDKLVDKDNHAFDGLTYGMLHYATEAVDLVPPDIPRVAFAKARAKMRDQDFDSRAKKAAQDFAERGACPNYSDSD